MLLRDPTVLDEDLDREYAAEEALERLVGAGGGGADAEGREGAEGRESAEGREDVVGVAGIEDA